MSLPFERTVCGCATCVDCCKSQPGSLTPGDFERIAAHLGEDLETAAAHFWASPGAVVMQLATREVYRIGTITPRLVQGRCVFLDAQDRCRVHPVAPAGCAYFDTHMSAVEGQRRGAAHLQLIMGSEPYTALRATLPAATSYNPRSY